MRAVLIQESTNTVVNIIELETDSKWQAPAGHFIRYSEKAAIGDVWDGEKILKQSQE